MTPNPTVQALDMESSKSIEINGTIYTPTKTVQESRKYRSKVLKFNDLDLRDLPMYKYPRLPSLQRRIRLLRLEGGGLGNPEITCELFEVEFGRDGVVRRREPGGRRRPDAYVNGTNTAEFDTSRTLDNEKGRSVEYEALSWFWGTESKDFGIRVKKGNITFRLSVTRELALALKYLRRPYGERILWIDALCINQEDYEERNHQVQMMSLIYNSALQVCVWLGEDNDDSATAILFTREIMKLENFDAISENKDNATKWQSLLLLMQRPWFSRRWVVQEIALAKQATIYCGKDEIPWENFAVAVELFVEVETATHRLSEVMQKTEAFGHVPQWFEHVSELGASVLVQATGKVYRRDSVQKSEHLELVKSKLPAKLAAIRRKQSRLSDPNELSRPQLSEDSPPPRPLLSLEYLVSSLTVFEASQPRDAVYSLLAIARDTSPLAELSSIAYNRTEEAIIMSTVSSFLERKPFGVDYSRPYSDVCKDFIAFCIERAANSDPTSALDILCRPWAPEPQPFGSATVVHKKPIPYKFQKKRLKLWTRPPESKDRPRPSKADTASAPVHHANFSANSLTGDGADEKSKPPSNADLIKSQNETMRKLVKDERSSETYFKQSYIPKDHRQWRQMIEPMLPKKMQHSLMAGLNGANHENKKSRNYSEYDHSDSEGESSGTSEQEEKEEPDLELPSWVSGISGAAFELFHHPGFHSMMRMGRKNADPLVGLPLDGHRNYLAAQNTKIDYRKLKFRKRPSLGHHSLYVPGFILDEIETVAEPARLGAVPETWPKLAGWDDAVEGESDPPAQFWRTLVADRGKDNRNPPYYYATACKESVKKGGLRGGSVDTGALINSERNSIIAEFCRRVQAVIWNRCLIKTKENRLGLASQNVKPGDKVCIIFGCTVPVILRRSTKRKTQQDIEQENLEDSLQSMRICLSRLEQRCLQRLRYEDAKKRQGKFKDLWVEEIREETVEINNQIASWKKAQEEANERKKKEEAEQAIRRAEAEKRLKDRRAALKKRRTELREFDNQPKRSDDSIHEEQANQRREKAKKEDPYWSYTLLGDAYIHGMMDGEAIRHHILELIPERLFEIR